MFAWNTDCWKDCEKKLKEQSSPSYHNPKDTIYFHKTAGRIPLKCESARHPSAQIFSVWIKLKSFPWCAMSCIWSSSPPWPHLPLLCPTSLALFLPHRSLWLHAVPPSPGLFQPQGLCSCSSLLWDILSCHLSLPVWLQISMASSYRRASLNHPFWCSN